MKNLCKVCEQEFSSERSLHAHLKKHDMFLAEYYTTYYPRKNRLTGDSLPFKNKEEYFSKDFSRYSQLIKWCNTAPAEEVKEYILEQLKHRIETKGHAHAPAHVELRLLELPPIDFYKTHFGSYSAACALIGFKPIYDKNINEQFFEADKKLNSLDIFIDTREQKPLSFPKSTSMKLDFGDYTVGGDDYNYTYIDRKSEVDFKSTMGINFQRFKKELERAQQFNSYLYILVESNINKIKKNNIFSPHKANLSYIFHNMRNLIHEFPENCQFIFAGTRRKAEGLVPKLLSGGKALWRTDIQYFLDHDELSRKT